MKSGNFRRRCALLIALVILIMATVLISGCALYSESKPSEPESKGLVIRYLTAPKQVEPSRGADVLCVATDEGGGILNYEWSATGGKIEVKKDPENILWVAPDKTGSYTVTVVVTNAKGDQATSSTILLVSNESPQYPVVISVSCENCTGGVGASRFSNYTLVCDAWDPNGDELKYIWFASIGKIKVDEGTGRTASWYTGGQYGNALITVIVTDLKGNKAEGYLAINVSCCNK